MGMSQTDAQAIHPCKGLSCFNEHIRHLAVLAWVLAGHVVQLSTLSMTNALWFVDALMYTALMRTTLFSSQGVITDMHLQRNTSPSEDVELHGCTTAPQHCSTSAVQYRKPHIRSACAGQWPHALAGQEQPGPGLTLRDQRMDHALHARMRDVQDSTRV